MALHLVSASSQYVSIPTGAFIRNASGASLAGWIYRSDTVANFFIGFNGLSVSPVKTRVALRFYSGASANLEVEARALDSDSSKYYNVGAFTSGAWNHFGVAIDWVNQWIKIYRNGVLAGTSGTLAWTSGNSQDNDNTTSAFVGNIIGGHPGHYGYISADCEDFRVYNRIVIVDEFMAMYVCKGIDGIKTGLTGRWLCKEAYPTQVVTSLIDAGPLQKNGTPSGSPTGAEGKIRYRRNT